MPIGMGPCRDAGTGAGLSTHALTGIRFGEAEADVGIPEDFQLEATFVIGCATGSEKLPGYLREREVPSNRKLLS